MCKSKHQVCTLHPTCALFGLLSELLNSNFILAQKASSAPKHSVKLHVL